MSFLYWQGLRDGMLAMALLVLFVSITFLAVKAFAWAKDWKQGWATKSNQVQKPVAPTQMRLCGNCSKMNNLLAKFCSGCGAPLITPVVPKASPAPPAPSKTCSKCGTVNKPDAKFCNKCGIPLPNMCSKCGGPVALGAKICLACGVKPP